MVWMNLAQDRDQWW